MAPAVAIWAVWSLASHEWRDAGSWAAGLRELAVPVVGPELAGFVRIWAGRLTGLAWFLVLQWSALAGGRRLGRWLGGESATTPTALALGWCLVAAASHALALGGLSRSAPLCLLLVVPPLTAGRDRRLPRLRLPSPPPGDALAALSALVVVATGALIVTAGQAPEVEMDSLTYHLDKARQALRAGRWVPREFDFYDLIPALWEMLLLPLLAAGGEPATRWFGPVLHGLMAGGAARLAADGGLRAAWGAAALVMSSPFLGRQALTSKNDLFAAVLGLAALESVVAATRSPARAVARLRPAGWLCGAGLAVKYTTGGYLLAAAGGAWLTAARRSRIRPLGSLIAWWAVAAAPALAASWLLAGDPVAPAGHRWFPSPWVSDLSMTRLRQSLHTFTRWKLAGETPWGFLDALWGTGGDTFLGWVALLPVVLLAPPSLAGGKASLGALAALAAAWLAGPPIARYGGLSFPLAFSLVARALTVPAPRPPPAAGRVLLAAALVLQSAHLGASGLVLGPLRAGIGAETPRSWRARALPGLAEAAEATNRIVPASGRLLLHGDIRSALFVPSPRFSRFTATAFLPFPLIRASRTLPELEKRFRQRGWTHVLVDASSALLWRDQAADDPWGERELTLWSRFWRGRARLVWETPSLRPDHFFLWRVERVSERGTAVILPGLDAWVWMMEEDIRAGRFIAAARRRATLEAAAGDWGQTDALIAEMFRSRLAPGEHRRRLERAVTRGWRSPLVYANLAGYAAADGDREAARGWMARARALAPGVAPAELLGAAERARREATAPRSRTMEGATP